MRRCLAALGLVLAACLPLAAQARAAHARDPFQGPPPRAPASALVAATVGAPFVLRAVLLDGAASLATINGRIVAVGDDIDGFRVTHIGARSVALRKGATRITLTIHPKVIE